MKNKKLSVLLIFGLMLVFTAAVAAQAAGSEKLTDISGHWAADTIEKWSSGSLVGGYPDGTFKPNRNITRAEFINIVNKALGYTEKTDISYSDVKSDDWFFEEITKAKKAEYISGYSDGTMKPNNPISRQEAAVIISRIMRLAENTDKLSDLADKDRIPAWSKGMVGALIANGYMKGYPDNTFRPTQFITRAESVASLDRVVGDLYNAAGTYGPETDVKTVTGNVTVSAGDVTLQNTTINGALHLTAGIGDGNVVLKNVVVTGTTIISGGGENSVVLDSNTSLNDVVVDRKDGKVRIVAKNGSSIKIVVMKSTAKMEQSETTVNAFGEIVVQVPEGTEVELAGNCDTVKVETPGVILKVASGATVGELVVASTATNANVNLEQGSRVTTLEVNSATNVTGQGTITNANINSSGTKIEQTPSNVVVAPGTTANVGGKDVSGKEETTPSTPGGSGGGGGTSAITVSSVTATFNDKDNLKDASAPFELNIKDKSVYPDKTLFTGVILEGTNVTGATLVIKELKVKNQKWLNDPIEVSISANGVVTTKQLLGDLDTGALGVNLGSLRAFGNDMVITGYVEKSNKKSSEITVTLQFSDDSTGDLIGVSNQWLDFSRDLATITGTIKPGKETVKLSDVTVLDFIWQGEVSTDNELTYISGKTAIQQAIADFVGEPWNDLELGDLKNKSIKYKNAQGITYTITIQ